MLDKAPFVEPLVDLFLNWQVASVRLVVDNGDRAAFADAVMSELDEPEDGGDGEGGGGGGDDGGDGSAAPEGCAERRRRLRRETAAAASALERARRADEDAGSTTGGAGSDEGGSDSAEADAEDAAACEAEAKESDLILQREGRFGLLSLRWNMDQEEEGEGEGEGAAEGEGEGDDGPITSLIPFDIPRNKTALFDAMKNSGVKTGLQEELEEEIEKAQELLDYFKTFHPKKITLNLFIDVLVNEGNPIDIWGWELEDVTLTMQFINIFNLKGELNPPPPPARPPPALLFCCSSYCPLANRWYCRLRSLSFAYLARTWWQR